MSFSVRLKKFFEKHDPERIYMIKKITFVILVCCILVSCGKKGDPEYKASNKEIKIPTIIINKIS